jgi:hypothetical protein
MQVKCPNRLCRFPVLAHMPVVQRQAFAWLLGANVVLHGSTVKNDPCCMDGQVGVPGISLATDCYNWYHL